MITLEIYSDPVCPWCYIGKVALERAMEARPDHPFAVTWHPFMLNPDMPADGMDRQEYLELKFGADLMSAYGPIVKRAEALGLDLNLPAITRQPNTAAAHALIHWAGLEGKQNAAVSALFRAYFKEGRDIGARDVLLRIADSIGMDRDLTARLLDAGADPRRGNRRRARTCPARVAYKACRFSWWQVSTLSPARRTAELWVQVIERIGPETGMTWPRPTRPLHFGEFVALMALMMSSVAFSIDAMLPALPTIGLELSPRRASERPAGDYQLRAGHGAGRHDLRAGVRRIRAQIGAADRDRRLYRGARFWPCRRKALTGCWPRASCKGWGAAAPRGDRHRHGARHV